MVEPEQSTDLLVHPATLVPSLRGKGDWGSQVTYGYDGAGRLLTPTRPNGIVTAYDYDDAGRLTDITHDNAHGELASYHYVLDGLGNRVQAVEHVLPPTPVTHLPIVMRDYDGTGDAMMSMPESSPAVQRQGHGPTSATAPLSWPCSTQPSRSEPPEQQRSGGVPAA
ncbi:MAG: RHS repeat protein [Anaerolineae bacterium]|nr:RHS repeat protein [Anaerolineae bacterium]